MLKAAKREACSRAGTSVFLERNVVQRLYDIIRYSIVKHDC